MSGAAADPPAPVTHWLLLYEYVEDYLERRAPFREAHLALARAAHDRGELLMAGAVPEPAGAVFVFRSDTAHAAEAFAGADPYVENGVVTGWSVRRWNVVVGPDGRP